VLIADEKRALPGPYVIRPAAGRHVWTPAALVLQDAILIYASLVAAYIMRYDFGLGPPIHAVTSFLTYQMLAVPLICVMIVLLFRKGLYQRSLNADIGPQLTAIVGSATVSVGILVVASYMLHQLEYSRGVIVFLWVGLIVLPGLGRLSAHFGRKMLYRRGIGVRRVLVVGGTEHGKMIMQSVRSRPTLGYDIIGFVDRRGESRVPDFGRFKRLGHVEDVPEMITEWGIDEVIVALPGSAWQDVAPVVRACHEQGIELKFIPDMFQMRLSQVHMDALDGIPLLAVRDQATLWFRLTMKRAFDLLVGCILLLLAAPAVTAAAILIRLDSQGPIFIRQVRVGRHGHLFSCWKLRSMHQRAAENLAALRQYNTAGGPIFKMRDDPRRTRVGRYLRMLSLDELPQLWNVVRGDMSLVGPRPPLPEEVDRYEPWQLRRLHVTPGLTGLWQISGRSDLSFDEMVMMDIAYIDNWTLSLDWSILLKTIPAVLAARGAY